MPYKFKRGEIVKSPVDYFIPPDQSLTMGRTYVVCNRQINEYGHRYVRVLDDRGVAMWFTEDSFYKIRKRP